MSETEITPEVPAPKARRKPFAPRVATQAASFTDEQFDRLIAAMAPKADQPTGGLDVEALKTILEGTAKVSADAMQRALKPENETHPGISVFSHPEGDVARPRPTLAHEFWWNGYPCHQFPETEHWRELELMTQVQPGEYTTIRRDGSLMHVTVKAERNADRAITKIFVEFPVSREDKALIPPKQVTLYQLVHSDAPKRRFVEAMTEHLALIMGAETETSIRAPHPIGA